LQGQLLTLPPGQYPEQRLYILCGFSLDDFHAALIAGQVMDVWQIKLPAL